jgi:Domain of unknown function (DUF4160)
MPTIRAISGPYRFFFYSLDCNEPQHVQRDKDTCKFWLEPISLARNNGFSPKELNIIRTMIEDELTRIMEAWHEYCG